MIGHNYYDELKKASIVPDETLKIFSFGKSHSSYFPDIILPSLKVLFYAITHEVQAFVSLMETIQKKKLPSYYNRRLKPEELFKCLCLLDEDCLLALFDQLEIGDAVLDDILLCVKENEKDQFKEIIRQSELNTKSIIPICRLMTVYLNYKELFDDISSFIKQSEIVNEEERTKIMKNAFLDFNQRFSSITIEAFFNQDKTQEIPRFYNHINSDQQNQDSFESAFIKALFKGLTKDLPEEKRANLSVEEFTSNLYKVFLLIFLSLESNSKLNELSLTVLGEILLSKKYKSIWDKYDFDSDSNLELVLLQELGEYFQSIGFVKSQKKSEEVSGDSGKTTQWHLPVEFFDKSYVVECDQDEYIPCFLGDKIKFAALTDTESKMIKVDLNLAFEEFINTLAKKGCIDDDDITKASFAHALTGRKVDVKTITVKWKRSQSSKDFGWLNNIFYIGRELYPKYIFDNKQNQIRKYDQIVKVFDLEFESIPSEKQLNYKAAIKTGSSYADSADEFIKNAVDVFLKYVEIIKMAIELPTKKTPNQLF